MRIHDLAWDVLLPQIEKLTYALEALLVINRSPTAQKNLIEARESLGNKMLPVRDAVCQARVHRSFIFHLLTRYLEATIRIHSQKWCKYLS
jgi:hypothetical protein